MYPVHVVIQLRVQFQTVWWRRGYTGSFSHNLKLFWRAFTGIENARFSFFHVTELTVMC